jgi:transcriptional regulator with PAS, ATPase and Fis domain
MSLGESGIDTVPEERAADTEGGGAPTLLIGSFALGAGRPVRVEGSPTIGRGRPADDGERERIDVADRLLSRQHLRIVRRQGGYSVEDLGSLNGSYLDGLRLEKPTALSEGSILLFGNHSGVFRRVSPPALAALAEEAAAPFGPVATLSPSLAVTLAKLRRLARTDQEILLVGESSVGKAAYARAIHRASGRSGAFVVLDCAALPARSIENVLFGAPSGTSAAGGQPASGLVEAAQGGTLLLSEVGELPPNLASRLSEFLRDRLFTPFGSTSLRRADVRILATTGRHGGPERRLGWQSDLLARLGIEPIRILPLRERPEDIGALAAHFAARAVTSLEPAAFRTLALHSWPLNLFELEKAIKHAVALSPDGKVGLDHLPGTVGRPREGGAPVALRRRPRPAPPRAELEHLLRQHQGNVSSVARSLDRKWAVVWRWIGKHQLHPDQFRP